MLTKRKNLEQRQETKKWGRGVGGGGTEHITNYGTPPIYKDRQKQKEKQTMERQNSQKTKR